MHIPYYKQETAYTCGAAAMRMALAAFGVKRTEKQVASMLGTNKVRGTWKRKLPRVAERFRLDYVVKRHSSVAELRRYLRKGYLVIVIHYVPDEDVDHYALVTKAGTKFLRMHDPWDGPDRRVGIRSFLEVWHGDARFDPEPRWFLAMRLPQRRGSRQAQEPL